MTEQTLTPPARQSTLAPDSLSDVWSGPAAAEPVLVTSGLYADQLPVAGRAVADIRRTVSDRLDIDPEAMAVLNGRRVRDEATTVRAGETLTFVRYGGEKG